MKNNMSFIVASLIVLAIIGFVGYRGYQEAHPTIPTTFDNLKVAYQEDDIDGYIMLDIAEDKGYLQQAGLVVERKVGLKSISSYVISGEVDLSQSALSVPLAGFLSDQDLKIIGITSRYLPMVHIISRFPEDSLASVKNVEIDRAGGAIQNNFGVIAKGLGLDAGAMNYVVSASAPATVALLEQGSVDFAMFSNMDAYRKLRDSGKYTFIDPQKAYKDVSSPMGLITTSKTISAKSDQLKKYVASLKKANAYYISHQSEMVAFIQAKYGFTKEEAQAAYSGIAAATKGLDYTVDTSLLSDVVSSVKNINKPSNASRDIQDFVGKL